MLSPDIVSGHEMEDLLREMFPEVADPNFETGQDYVKVPLLASMLKDIEAKEYPCKVCERLHLQHHLRFFVINEHTEIFKCESRQCMFPFRNFIFRDRQNQSFYTCKVLPQPTSPLRSQHMPVVVPHRIASPPNSAHFEDILCELFPTDSPNYSQVSSCDGPQPTGPPPAGPAQSVSSSPQMLSKTMNLIAKKREVSSSFIAQPKNIKSPLDLVKDLLKRKTRIEEPQMEKSLAVAKSQLQPCLSKLSQPNERSPVTDTGEVKETACDPLDRSSRPKRDRKKTNTIIEMTLEKESLEVAKRTSQPCLSTVIQPNERSPVTKTEGVKETTSDLLDQSSRQKRARKKTNTFSPHVEPKTRSSTLKQVKPASPNRLRGKSRRLQNS